MTKSFLNKKSSYKIVKKYCVTLGDFFSIIAYRTISYDCMGEQTDNRVKQTIVILNKLFLRAASSKIISKWLLLCYLLI